MSIYTDTAELKKLFEQENIFKPATPDIIKQREDEIRQREQEATARRERLERERKANLEKNRRAFKTKSHKALQMLGMTKIKDNPYGWSDDRLTTGTNAAGEEIHLFYSDSDNRIRVDGEYPKDRAGASHDYYGSTPGNYTRVPRPSITISNMKTAEQIVADINRRLIPQYKEHFAAAKKSAESHDAYEDKTLASLELVKGSKLTDYETKNKKISISVPTAEDRDHGIYGNAKASGDSIEMELRSLAPDQARRIMLLIGGSAS